MKSDKNVLILYHGSPNKEIRPTYGLGNTPENLCMH